MQEELNEALVHLRAINAILAALTGAQPAPAAPSDTQAVIAPPSDRDPHFGGNSYDASLLRELLAVIHRDGGHYIAQHGIEKACADAAAQWLAAPAAQPADSAMTAVPDMGMACPTAPDRIWLQADPEPAEEGKPVYPPNPSQDDVTWCWDKINASDTLYIRADLVRALVAKETPHAR